MAGNDKDLNLRGGENAGAASPKGRKLLWVVLALLVLGGAGVAWWFLVANEADSAQNAPDAKAPVAEAQEPPESHYLAMQQLLVNFDYQGSMRYVQTEMQLMAHDESVLEAAAHNMPALRNRLIMLLSDQDFAALRTVEGKEALRQAVRQALNQELAERGAGAIDDVYFTSFVLQ